WLLFKEKHQVGDSGLCSVCWSRVIAHVHDYGRQFRFRQILDLARCDRFAIVDVRSRGEPDSRTRACRPATANELRNRNALLVMSTVGGEQTSLVESQVKREKKGSGQARAVLFPARQQFDRASCAREERLERLFS